MQIVSKGHIIGDVQTQAMTEKNFHKYLGIPQGTQARSGGCSAVQIPVVTEASAEIASLGEE